MICGKIIFKTKNEAANAIAGMQSDTRPTKANRKPQNTYWCAECQGYHIHSKQKKKRYKVKSESLDTRGEKKFKYAPEKLIIRNFTSKPIK